MKVLSVDVGTTNLKVALVKVTKDGFAIDKTINMKIPPHIPEPQSYEHDPRELRDLVLRSIKTAIREGGDVDAITLSGYLFGVLALDKQGNELTNIITWVDERPRSVLNELKSYAQELYMRTGCPPLHIYALPKILWLRRVMGSKFSDISMFLDMKAYLMKVLTGMAITDYSSASGTFQLLNIHSLRWDSRALELAGIDEKMLPELEEGTKVLEMRKEVAEYAGLREPAKVVLGLFDGASMILGFTLLESNRAVVNMGTSAMLRTVIDRPVVDSSPLMRFQTYYMLNGRWLSGGAINNAGIVLDWVLDSFFRDLRSSSDVVDPYRALLETLPEEPSDIIFVPLILSERLPFLSAGAVIAGLKHSTSRREIAKAALEGIAMLLKLIDEALEENGIVYRDIVAGGKLAKFNVVARVLANVLGKPVSVPEIFDAVHIGNTVTVLMAIKAASRRELSELIAMYPRMEVAPDNDLVTYYRELYRRFKELALSTNRAANTQEIPRQ